MRTCGGCTACCVALAVQELDKPRYYDCAHLGDAGCDRYADRPPSCRDYRCLWLMGHLGEDDRPDKLGVIFSTTSDPARPELGKMPMLIEVRDGALDTPRLRHALRGLLDQRPVVILTRHGHGTLPPVQLTVAGESIRVA